MKILFMRKEEGVYQYGSKEVHLKVEQIDDQINAHVDKLELDIDEFIDKYCSTE